MRQQWEVETNMPWFVGLATGCQEWSMEGNLPPAPDGGAMRGPVGPMAWGQPLPLHSPPRPRAWPAIALALIAVVLGGAALFVALTHPAGTRPTISAPTTTPAPSGFDGAASHKQLCDAYRTAARAVQIDTNGDNVALAGVASVNAALMLEQVVSASPAMSAGDRTAALNLAAAYTNATAMGTWLARDDPAWRAEVDDVNAKDAAMKKVCGIG